MRCVCDGSPAVYMLMTHGSNANVSAKAGNACMMQQHARRDITAVSAYTSSTVKTMDLTQGLLMYPTQAKLPRKHRQQPMFHWTASDTCEVKLEVCPLRRPQAGLHLAGADLITCHDSRDRS
jgi:hypothetical protein